ncbi:asparaginase [Hydrogenophaga sp. A37]|uniref:asparaginase n=1 Tax=Hydrogenophaga sp. A37 TaxID=1945864 RepID=UPI00098588AD|nr:asparaginase [Hydrogenophaga sp. A37]OOG80406.1 L-asparaginase [Hydrogenophaga sp. A37]
MQRRVILGTGGTIAGRSDRQGDNVGYVAGEVRVEDLMARIPALSDMSLEVEQVDQIDSKDMHFGLWKRLAERVAHHLAREDVAGLVITHGTDTLEETAYFLEKVLRPNKPVVLTCAMRPSTALVPDGPQNLLDAVNVAGCVDLSGVVVVCAGMVHRAEHVVKVHSYRVDAFDSGDAGPVACVEEGEVRWFHSSRRGSAYAAGGTALLEQVLSADALPRVDIVTSHADTDGGLVRALLAASAVDAAHLPRGLVVAATGNGTVHRDLEAALREAQLRGVRVIRSTRCARGRVIPDAKNPLRDSAGLSPVKARLALALDLLSE